MRNQFANEFARGVIALAGVVAFTLVLAISLGLYAAKSMRPAVATSHVATDHVATGR
jgi:hypothetical protein